MEPIIRPAPKPKTIPKFWLPFILPNIDPASNPKINPYATPLPLFFLSSKITPSQYINFNIPIDTQLLSIPLIPKLLLRNYIEHNKDYSNSLYFLVTLHDFLLLQSFHEKEQISYHNL